MEEEARKVVEIVLRFRDAAASRRVAQVEIDQEAERIRITAEDGAVDEVPFAELKAVFFMQGSANPITDVPEGSVLAVEFQDGEVIRGLAPGYNPEKNGFYLIPLDRSRNDRIFVVNSAIVSIDVERL